MTSSEEWRGKIGKLSEQEQNEFLGGAPFCRFGCLDDEGWPYVVPCWYEYQDGGFYIVPRGRSKWAEYVKNDGRAFLCIDDSDMYNRRVLVKGRAEVLEERVLGGKWVEIAESMSRRYLGEHGPDYIEPTMVEPRWLLFVKPLSTMSWQGVDWPKRYKHAEW